MTVYAEIGVTTNFSFLRGASHPQEYVHRASKYGLYAIGIADCNSAVNATEITVTATLAM